MKKRSTLLFLISLLSFSVATAQEGPPKEAQAYPCLDSEVRRKFDFWLGEWNVYVAGKLVGESSITLAKGGCAIHESFTTPGPYAGQSINYYDPLAKKWRQNWVGSAGDVGIYEETDSGEGNIQFQARQLRRDGSIVLRKMTFYYDPDQDTVRQLIEDSTDEGVTWTAGFDGFYKRK